MNGERGRSPLRRVVKPASFLLVVALLLVFSRLMVPFVVEAGGASGLPDNLQNKVIITSFDGQSQTTPQDISTEDEAPPVSFNTWNQTTNQVVVQPETSSSAGCSTAYDTVITVDIATANEFPQEMKAVMNVTVTERGTGAVLAAHLLTIDFKPNEPSTVETTFSLVTEEASPILVIQATFPSSADLRSAPATVLHVPLFEYLLMKIGMISPTF